MLGRLVVVGKGGRGIDEEDMKYRTMTPCRSHQQPRQGERNPTHEEGEQNVADYPRASGCHSCGLLRGLPVPEVALLPSLLVLDRHLDFCASLAPSADGTQMPKDDTLRLDLETITLGQIGVSTVARMLRG